MTSMSSLIETPEPPLPETLPDLIQLSSELQNSIQHLEDSNYQLNEALKNEFDECLYQAVVENEFIISKKKQRLESVQNEIDKLNPEFKI